MKKTATQYKLAFGEMRAPVLDFVLKTIKPQKNGASHFFSCLWATFVCLVRCKSDDYMEIAIVGGIRPIERPPPVRIPLTIDRSDLQIRRIFWHMFCCNLR